MGLCKIVYTPFTAVKRKKSQAHIKRRLKALRFRFPMQLLSNVQWWS